MHSNDFDRVFRERRTVKLLADSPQPAATDRETVRELLECAHWAPFHLVADASHRQNDLTSPVPWRAYVLDVEACRASREMLLSLGDRGKVPQLLACASAAIVVTWLPSPNDADELFSPTQVNMEHIAAAGAAIQNILLAATCRQIPNYWSSGGALRKPEFLARLGAGGGEILLGVVFLFPVEANLETAKPGKLRDERGTVAEWSRWASSGAFDAA